MPKFVDALHVDAVNPSLIQDHEEDQVVTKARHAMEGWHLDDECEQVVDEGIECLVPAKQQAVTRRRGGDGGAQPASVTSQRGGQARARLLT